jgi:putative ABC transport system ATP-binding protein
MAEHGSLTADPLEGPFIVCQDLFKIYKIADLEVVALRGLDLQVRRGEFIGMVGASGSGKSTVLNILAGLDTPSAGRCEVAGRDLLSMTDDELVQYRRKVVGFVWQQTGRNLVPYLNARENIEVPMVLDGVTGRAARERALELLDAVGLPDRDDAGIDTLSGGEQQRVAIAVALANNPPLLLADEPTGELDSHTAEDVFAALRELNTRYGTTIIVVTHDPAIAGRVDRVVAIRDGRISTEILRTTGLSPRGEMEVVRREYAVVDRSGRLQLPREAVEATGIRDRARVEVVGGHVEVHRAEEDRRGG